MRGAIVEAVHAWDVPYSLAFSAAAVDFSAFEEAAQDLLDRTVGAAEAEARGVAVERVLLTGSATDALLGASKEADLVIVGSRGVGGFRRLLLGSVSYQLARHATCPVVVVPPEDGAATGATWPAGGRS